MATGNLDVHEVDAELEGVGTCSKGQDGRVHEQSVHGGGTRQGSVRLTGHRRKSGATWRRGSRHGLGTH